MYLRHIGIDHILFITTGSSSGTSSVVAAAIVLATGATKGAARAPLALSGGAKWLGSPLLGPKGATDGTNYLPLQ